MYSSEIKTVFSRSRSFPNQVDVGMSVFARNHEFLNLDLQVSLGFSAIDRKSTRLNSSHSGESRMPSSA